MDCLHCLVDLVHVHLAVDLFHGGAGIFHGEEGFLVDICGFDGVDLLFEHGDCGRGLFQGVLELLLAFEGVAGGFEFGIELLALCLIPLLYVKRRLLKQ